MSTAEILSLISLISYIAAGIALVLSVFFWFFFKIPTVVGDLSGRTARKSIARKRASNERAAGKGYQPSVTNVNRGKLTYEIQQTHKPKEEPKKKVAEDALPDTGVLQANKAQIHKAQETELLAQTTELETTGSEETAELASNTPNKQVIAESKKLKLLEEVILIHTEEVIS